jgi:2-keto-4-pentenoate hydratase/2-oxohepta-3-ene-1,7-dioic acid hydratase in catechol pathway
MKLARYEFEGTVRLGEVVNDEVRELVTGPAADAVESLAQLQAYGGPVLARRPLVAVRLLSPVVAPSKIMCIGLNYRDHCRETGTPEPSEPVLFAKYPNSIVGPGDPITWSTSEAHEVDWEVELAVIISKRTLHVRTSDALDNVLGYTIANDVSARDVQFSNGGQWTRGKSFDTFLPLGPWIVTSDELRDPQILGIQATVSGTRMQDSSTSEMIFSVAEIISFLSRTMTLEVGDVIATGTPHGVGFTRTPPRFLEDGDLVRLEVNEIGALENPVSVAP